MDVFDRLDPDAAAALRGTEFTKFTGDLPAYLAEVRSKLDEAPLPPGLPVSWRR